jgi:copper chaperone NosL
MRSKLSIIVVVFSLLLTVSCKVEPKEINYGQDHCVHCDMTVVDKSHSAEYVTKKGKAYMFDAVECMVMKVNQDKNEDQMKFLLVADYANPGELVDAKTATFLISEKIKSPMGANLSAFSSKESAEKFLKESGGKLFTWDQLKAELSN